MGLETISIVRLIQINQFYIMETFILKGLFSFSKDFKQLSNREFFKE